MGKVEHHWLVHKNVNMTRREIEEYYLQNWNRVISPSTLDVLIELTCVSYKLSNPPIPKFVQEKEPVKPQDLGKI